MAGRQIGEGLMSLLRVESLNKRFGGLMAVSQASFEVKEGEIVGLIGPNGAGKTTLFNLITGAITPDSGSVTFNGQDLKGLSSYQICRAGIARTFQVPRPFAKMTCSENVLVALIGRNTSVPQPERPGTIREMLELVGLAGKERVLSADLNLIDTKRLEVARALATGPRLILLDEVLGGLSSMEMSQALDLIRAIRDRFGVTVLWIEHVMGAIMSLSESVLVLNQGRLICEGAPDAVTRDKRVIEAYLGEPDAQD
jgi:branched-chain amino acid transport system ATP-binding protein